MESMRGELGGDITFPFFFHSCIERQWLVIVDNCHAWEAKKVDRLGLGVSLFLSLFLLAGTCLAGTSVVTTRASCAIVEMTAEQAILLAKQRARAAAIESAAGVRVTSSSLVTDGRLAADFIKTFSRGFVIKEEARWSMSSYQKDPAMPPIPQYDVELTATVVVPERRTSYGLKADLSRTVFRTGENGWLTVRTGKPARIAVFNLMADGRVAMIFPANKKSILSPGSNRDIRLPSRDSGIEMKMVTLPDHAMDAEGFFVAALDAGPDAGWLDHFTPCRAMALDEFFPDMPGWRTGRRK